MGLHSEAQLDRRTASLRHMISYIKEHHYGIYHQLPKSLRRDHHL